MKLQKLLERIDYRLIQGDLSAEISGLVYDSRKVGKGSAFVCIVGAIGSGQLVWDISDTLNGLMAIPNLIALLLLSGVIISMTKEFFADKK